MAGKDILRIRTRLSLTQAEFAALIGTTPVTVSRWECGHTDPLPIFERAILELDRGQKKTNPS